MVIIQKKIRGNHCWNWDKIVQGKGCEYTVYQKSETEKRGHNNPCCCLDCAKTLKGKLENV